MMEGRKDWDSLSEQQTNSEDQPDTTDYDYNDLTEESYLNK